MTVHAAAQPFVFCPCVHKQAHDLYLSDFTTHDMSAAFLLLAEQHRAERELKEAYEVSGRPTTQLVSGSIR